MENYNYKSIAFDGIADLYRKALMPPKRKVELIDFFNEYCNEMNNFRNLYKIKYPEDDIILCYNSKPIPINYQTYLPARASFTRYTNLF